MSDSIVFLTDESFQNEVIESAEPVLVDYWAEWCGPCKMIAPILTEIASEYQGKIKVAKLDVESRARQSSEGSSTSAANIVSVSRRWRRSCLMSTNTWTETSHRR